MDLIVRAPQGSRKGLIIDKIIEEDLSLYPNQKTEIYLNSMDRSLKSIDRVKKFILLCLDQNIKAFVIEVYNIESANLWLSTLTDFREQLGKDFNLFFYTHT